MNAKLHELMSSKERIKILREAIYLERCRVGEIARKLELSKGLVSKYFELLAKEGIMKRAGNEFVILENAKTRGLRIFLNVSIFADSLFSKYKFVKSAGLYGSSAKGENKKDSDIDLWVQVNKASDEEIARLHSELGKEINGLSLLVLSDAKIGELKKKDKLFYNSLVFGSIIVYGEKDEI